MYTSDEFILITIQINIEMFSKYFVPRNLNLYFTYSLNKYINE